jgi:hypothetical protein
MAHAAEGVERLALGMQRFAAPADEEARSKDRLDLMRLVPEPWPLAGFRAGDSRVRTPGS